MTCTRCTKCNRPLKRATASGMGDKCERAAYGSRRKRQRAAQPADLRQTDLFAQDLQYANRVDALLGSISLEMPR